MGRRIKLVLTMATILVGLLALQAGPVMADDDDCDFRERGNRDDVVVCRDDGDREVFEADDFYYNDDFLDGDDSFYYSPFLYVEEIDIDCDEIDDDSDGWVDEGAVCEVEVEFEEVFDQEAGSTIARIGGTQRVGV